MEKTYIVILKSGEEIRIKAESSVAGKDGYHLSDKEGKDVGYFTFAEVVGIYDSENKIEPDPPSLG